MEHCETQSNACCYIQFYSVDNFELIVEFVAGYSREYFWTPSSRRRRWKFPYDFKVPKTSYYEKQDGYWRVGRLLKNTGKAHHLSKVQV